MKRTPVRWAVAFFALAAAPAVAEVRVFENFTLIDGTGRPPVAAAAMVVRDGKIEYAGPRSGMRAPAGAERLDLAGRWVMPGLIDLHVHLGNVKGLVQDPKFFTRENLEEQLRTYAWYGVTAVVSMGSDADLVYQVRAEQRAGRPSLTRIFTAGRGFTNRNGYPSSVPGMKGIPFEVETAEDVRRAVSQLADKRVDVVKIWVDDHLGKEPKISIDLCRAIIEEAHRHNLKVAAHIFYLEDSRKLVEAGVDALAHSVRDRPVDAELISMMKKRGTWQIPTLTRELSTFVYARPHPFLDDPFFTRWVDPQVIATLKSAEYQKKLQADPNLGRYEEFLRTAQKNLKALAAAGVKVGFGTDTGPPARFSGYFDHWEMELMAEAGMSPMEILRSATGRAAEYLGAKDLGTLEKGKWADLVVLTASPLENLRNTRAIESVWIAGNRVR
jgi:imidazolonepropionase-like amidohydrolase